MAWRSKRVFGALAAALLLAGCAAVVTNQPLPADANPPDRAQLEGTWLADGGEGDVLAARFACDGVGHLGYLKWEDGKFNHERGEAVIAQARRGAADAHFMSVRFEDRGQWSDYFLLRYKLVGRQNLVVWLPDPRAFTKAVKEGRLKGEPEAGGAKITGPPEALLDFLLDPRNGPLFDFQEPLVLRKVAEPRGAEAHESCGPK